MFYLKVINYLRSIGYKVDENYEQIQIACPICRENDRDNKGDHLGINTNTNQVNCLLDPEHTKEIIKRALKFDSQNNIQVINTNSITITEDFIFRCRKNLLKDVEKLKIFSEVRGFTSETIKEMNIGYVNECDVFCLPAIDLDGNLYGAEFTTLDFEQKWKAKGTKSKLCLIHKGKETKDVIVFEGFFDAIGFYQFLKERHLSELYTILTPSNGAPSVPKLLKELKIEEDQRLILCMDKDPVGRDAIKKATYKSDSVLYSLNLPCNCCKDFNEYYLSHKGDLGEVNVDDNVQVIPLSLIKSKLITPKKCDLGEYYSAKCYDHTFNLRKQLIEHHNTYYEVKAEVKSETINEEDNIEYTLITYRRVTNYIIEPKDIHIEAHDGDKSKNIYNLRLKVISISGKKSDYIILDPKSKTNLREFRVTIGAKGNYCDVLDNKQLAQILDNIYSEAYLKLCFYYSQAGLIETENLWLYDNAAVNLSNGQIIPINKDGLIELSNNRYIALADAVEIRAVLRFSNEYSPTEIAKMFIENIWYGYGNTVSPFLILGTSLLSPYRHLIREINGGYPLCFLYGFSGGGKSNILKLIECLYGYDNNFIRSGDSTIRAIWNVLKLHKNIPVLFDEMIKRTNMTEFEGLIKSAYEGILRDKMLDGVQHNIQKVNATLVISSNFLPPEKEEIFNRMIFTNFDPAKFNVEIVKQFNEIRDTCLSSILPSILLFGSENIEAIYKSYFDYLKSNTEVSDYRLIGNFAVALTGIDLLFKLANISIYSELLSRVVQYLNEYTQIVKHETVFERFLSFLPMIKDKDLIGLNSYIEVVDDKNTKILKIRSRELFNHYTKYLKNEFQSIPSYQEFLNSAKMDSRVLMVNNKPGTIRIHGKTVKGFKIDITDNEELHILEQSSSVPGNDIPDIDNLIDEIE